MGKTVAYRDSIQWLPEDKSEARTRRDKLPTKETQTEGWTSSSKQKQKGSFTKQMTNLEQSSHHDPLTWFRRTFAESTELGHEVNVIICVELLY